MGVIDNLPAWWILMTSLFSLTGMMVNVQGNHPSYMMSSVTLGNSCDLPSWDVCDGIFMGMLWGHDGITVTYTHHMYKDVQKMGCDHQSLGLQQA